LLRPHFLALLVEALKEAGQIEEALRVAEEGLARGDRNGEHYYHAELYRLKGELLAAQSTKAEECFDQAIQLARAQQAKSFELRAAMSWARLHKSRGRSNEGRSRLAEVYDTFTEGFDTADLREAKALLM
jgi:predicted ATPase